MCPTTYEPDMGSILTQLSHSDKKLSEIFIRGRFNPSERINVGLKKLKQLGYIVKCIECYSSDPSSWLLFACNKNILLMLRYYGYKVMDITVVFDPFDTCGAKHDTVVRAINIVSSILREHTIHERIDMLTYWIARTLQYVDSETVLKIVINMLQKLRRILPSNPHHLRIEWCINTDDNNMVREAKAFIKWYEINSEQFFYDSTFLLILDLNDMKQVSETLILFQKTLKALNATSVEVQLIRSM